jgi:hypothetical protein
MCISANPAEFSGTIIAHFPAEEAEYELLSYTNTTKSAGNAQNRTADSGANALIFPVHGSDIELLDCPNPEASRKFLQLQAYSGLHREQWNLPDNFDIEGSMRYRTMKGASLGVQIIGNYLVGVANNVETIPGVLEVLRRTSSRPDHVPEVSDTLLEIMDRYYRAQTTGMPAFVIGAFLLDGSKVEDKHPITTKYAPFDSDKLVLPALDYHGTDPALEPFVTRDHTLLIATRGLNSLMQPLTPKKEGNKTPLEFANAPHIFPVNVRDKRVMRPEAIAGFLEVQEHEKFGPLCDPKFTRQQLEATMAPNTDYVIDTAKLEADMSEKIDGITARFDEIMDSLAPHQRQYSVTQSAAKALETLGRDWVLQNSNQLSGQYSDYISGHKAVEAKKQEIHEKTGLLK